MAVKKAKKESVSVPNKTEAIVISAPKLQVAAFLIRGDAPYVQHAFSQKARGYIEQREKMLAGSTAKKGKKREPKDFQKDFELAQHRDRVDGWNGIPAPAFRCAAISACRVCGFQMTRAKLAIRVLADGFSEDGTPLVRITKGEPVYHEGAVRNATGVMDIRARPMWLPGWEAVVRYEYDADQFTAQDVANLVMRSGLQVGIGEGRPDSKKSAGMGWGTFEIVEEE